MGLMDFFNLFSGKPKGKNGKRISSAGNNYGQSRPKMSSRSFFTKIEERINNFDQEKAFKAKTAITEINRFISWNTEEEIIAQLGAPILKSVYEDQGIEFLTLKFNYSIYDYNVRLFFFLIEGEVFSTLYEFKEVFPSKSQKLDLIYQSLFNNYIDGVNAEEFLKTANQSSVYIADKNQNFVHISSHVLLNIFYVKNVSRLKNIFASLNVKKDNNEREIEQQRLSQLKNNL